MTGLAAFLHSPAGWVGVAFGCLLLALAFEAWELSVAPRLIPRAEIDRLVAQTLARYGDPESAAFREERHYWHRCDIFECGKWRRVRREIRRRLQA